MPSHYTTDEDLALAMQQTLAEDAVAQSEDELLQSLMAEAVAQDEAGQFAAPVPPVAQAAGPISDEELAAVFAPVAEDPLIDAPGYEAGATVQQPQASAPFSPSGWKQEDKAWAGLQGELDTAVGEQSAAIAQQQQAVDVMEGAAEQRANLEADLASKREETERQKAVVQRDTKAQLAQMDDQIAEMSAREPDPGRWWARRGGLRQAALMLSAAIDGGLNPGGVNQTVNLMIAEKDKDVAIQMARMDRELAAARQARVGILEQNDLELQALGAEYAAETAHFDSLLRTVKVLEARATSAQQKAALRGVHGQILQRAAETKMKISDSISQRAMQRQLTYAQIKAAERAAEAKRNQRTAFDPKAAAVPEAGVIVARRPKKDAEGNPVLDERGNPVMEERRFRPDQNIPMRFANEKQAEEAREKITNYNTVQNILTYIMEEQDLLSDPARASERTARGAKLRVFLGALSGELLESVQRLTDLDLKKLEQSLVGAGIDQWANLLTADDFKEQLRLGRGLFKDRRGEAIRGLYSVYNNDPQTQAELAQRFGLEGDGWRFGYDIAPVPSSMLNEARAKAKAAYDEAMREAAAKDLEDRIGFSSLEEQESVRAALGLRRGTPVSPREAAIVVRNMSPAELRLLKMDEELAQLAGGKFKTLEQIRKKRVEGGLDPGLSGRINERDIYAEKVKDDQSEVHIRGNPDWNR